MVFAMRTSIALTLIAASASFAGTLPIDDRALEAKFLQYFSPLADSGEHVKVPDLLSQLNERTSTDPVDLLQAETAPLSAAQIYEQRRDSVVAFGNLFKCDKCDKWHSNLAGGVILTADGIVLTNHHVVDNSKAEVLGVITASGKSHPVIEVLAASKDDDLALVRIDPQGEKLTPAPVAYDEPVGSDVIAISHPDSRYFTLTKGTVSRYYFLPEPRGKSTKERMAITADYARGSSGCPIFNDRGAVVGLVSSTNSIYYSKEKGVDKNLQMVIKAAIPMASIKHLFSEKSE